MVEGIWARGANMRFSVQSFKGAAGRAVWRCFDQPLTSCLAVAGGGAAAAFVVAEIRAEREGSG